MLGVDPSAFRAFAARPTAKSQPLWQNVAAGGVAVSYTMGKLDKLPLGRALQVAGQRIEKLPVAGLGTVGIGGVDAVVSDTVARSLGIPAEQRDRDQRSARRPEHADEADQEGAAAARGYRAAGGPDGRGSTVGRRRFRRGRRLRVQHRGRPGPEPGRAGRRS